MLQRRGALLTRDRPNDGTHNGPGSAAHHSHGALPSIHDASMCASALWLMLRRARDTHSSPERGDNGGECRIGLGAVGAAGLRHVGASAAAFAAQKLGTFLDKIDGREARGEI